MKTLLRLAALLCSLWTIGLFGLREQIVPADVLTPVGYTLINTLAVSQLAFTVLFLLAARAPRANLPVVYAGILLMAAKVIADLYHSLALLPPETAIFTIVDLVLSFSLVVGMLEALPRLLNEDRG